MLEMLANVVDEVIVHVVLLGLNTFDDVGELIDVVVKPGLLREVDAF